MLRYVLAPRWWFMHLVVAALFALCVWLGAWQWVAAQQPGADDAGLGGHLRNQFYAFQWWFFGLFGLWFWGRFLRDQREADARYEAEWLAAHEAQEAQAADGQGGDSADSVRT